MRVRERHHEVAADPRLEVLRGDAAEAAGAVEASLERVGVDAHRALDRDLDQLRAQVADDRPRVLLRLRAGVGGGHDDAGQPLAAERVGGDQRDQRRVDAARDGDDDVAEAVLLDVVAKAGDERRVDLVEVGERLLDSCRARRRARRRGSPRRTALRAPGPRHRRRARSSSRRRPARPGRRRGSRRRTPCRTRCARRANIASRSPRLPRR